MSLSLSETRLSPIPQKHLNIRSDVSDSPALESKCRQIVLTPSPAHACPSPPDTARRAGPFPLLLQKARIEPTHLFTIRLKSEKYLKFPEFQHPYWQLDTERSFWRHVRVLLRLRSRYSIKRPPCRVGPEPSRRKLARWGVVHQGQTVLWATRLTLQHLNYISMSKPCRDNAARRSIMKLICWSPVYNAEIPAHSCNKDGATCIAGLGGPVKQAAMLTSNYIRRRIKPNKDLGLKAAKLHGLHGDTRRLQIPSQAPPAVKAPSGPDSMLWKSVDVHAYTCIYDFKYVYIYICTVHQYMYQHNFCECLRACKTFIIKTYMHAYTHTVHTCTCT